MANAPTRSSSGMGTGETWSGSPSNIHGQDFGRANTGAADDAGVAMAGDMIGERGTGSADKGLMSKASEKMLDTVESQKTAGVNLMSDMAGAVRRAAGEFEGQIPQAAEYIRYAADQMDNMSDAVRRRDVGQIVSELQSFARRQPTAFLGATFLAGFAAMRFLKSSSAGAMNSTAAMRAPRSDARVAGMERYGDFSTRSSDSPVSPTGL